MPKLITSRVTLTKLCNQRRYPTTDEQIEKTCDRYNIESRISQVFGHVCNLGLLWWEDNNNANVGISRRGHGDKRLYCVKRKNANFIHIYI
jgi:hypothetical protein